MARRNVQANSATTIATVLTPSPGKQIRIRFARGTQVTGTVGGAAAVAFLAISPVPTDGSTNGGSASTVWTKGQMGNAVGVNVQGADDVDWPKGKMYGAIDQPITVTFTQPNATSGNLRLCVEYDDTVIRDFAQEAA